MTGSSTVRRNAWGLGGSDWPDALLWYARGVAAMKKRPLADPLSWRFFAAIHGFEPTKWGGFGYYDANQDSLPSTTNLDLYWWQCWHGSWYFLPWHRGYLIAFEQAIRAEIVALNGPADWTLPYWNYFGSGQQAIPPAFASTTWPDGNDNPLYETHRYGRNGDGVVVIPLDDPEPDLDIYLDALDDSFFAGSAGGAQGFGGADTGVTNHGGGTHGNVESNPHDLIHVLVGGMRTPGLMSDPDTAGLDPIFYLHHANIDRLWEVWRRNSTTHTDPGGDTSWPKGPAPAGGPAFAMPVPATTPGQDPTQWLYTPAQMSDLGSLNYGYDDYEDDGTHRSRRGTRARPTPDRRRARGPELAMPESTSPGETRLIGATRGSMNIVGPESTTTLHLTAPDVPPRRRARARGPEAEPQPERAYLNLENITAAHDGAILRVYVGGPGGVDEQAAGSVALFGAAPQGIRGGGTANDGMTVVLDITDIVDDLNLSDNDLNELSVRVVPVAELDAESDVKVGRLSLYTQSQ
jgi:tyrosinase